MTEAYITKKEGRKTIIVPTEWIDSSGYHGKDIRFNPYANRWEVFDYNTGFEKYAAYNDMVYGKTKREAIMKCIARRTDGNGTER